MSLDHIFTIMYIFSHYASYNVFNSWAIFLAKVNIFAPCPQYIARWTPVYYCFSLDVLLHRETIACLLLIFLPLVSCVYYRADLSDVAKGYMTHRNRFLRYQCYIVVVDYFQCLLYIFKRSQVHLFNRFMYKLYMFSVVFYKTYKIWPLITILFFFMLFMCFMNVYRSSSLCYSLPLIYRIGAVLHLSPDF